MSLKSFIQRGRRGYADKDLVQFDTYLAKILSSATLDLYELEASPPPSFGAVFNYEMSKSKDQVIQEAWDNILLDIHDGFTDFSRGDKGTSKFLDGMHMYCQYFEALKL